MKHTFLFEPGVWTAEGTFWRGDGEALAALGRTDITHKSECWLLSGTMKVLGSPTIEFVNAYSIATGNPGALGSQTLKWDARERLPRQAQRHVLGGRKLHFLRLRRGLLRLSRRGASGAAGRDALSLVGIAAAGGPAASPRGNSP